MKKPITLIVAFLMWTAAISQTTVSGNITGVWNLSGSPYIVIGNINVVDSLIIDPGVAVKFNVGGFYINVAAGDKFIAKGTCNNPITFDAYTTQNPGSWNGLIFNGSGNDDSLFYCDIQSATDGIYITGGSGTYINYCIIHNNSLNGIQVRDNANPFIANCIIYHNTYHGIWVYCLNNGNTLAKIYNCVSMYNCASGIGVRTASSSANAHPCITNCTLALNYQHGLDIQQNVGVPDATISNSIIAYNGAYGINKGNGSSIGINDITFNCFWQNNSGTVYNLSGPGFGFAAQQSGSYLNGCGDSSDINLNIYYNPLFLDFNCIRCNSGFLLQNGSKCRLSCAATQIICGQIDTSIHQIGAFPSCSPLCNSPCYDTCAPPNSGVGIESFGLDEANILIYPNPTTGNFIIEFGKAFRKGKIEISNILGENVFVVNFSNESKMQINIKNISQGIYFVKIFDGAKYYCKKIIIE